MLEKIIKDKTLTNTERKVLEYIIEHIDDVMKMGVRNIAKENFTSTSVIMRLAKKLGYSGFVDMHYKLLPYIKSPSYENTNKDVLSLFQYQSVFELNNHNNILKFIQMLESLERKFIFIYATGFSGIIAEYIHKKLLVLGKKSMIASGSDSSAVFENNLEDIGLFIALSKSGETINVLNKARTARENNIPVISFTNEIENSLSELSLFSFKIHDNLKSDSLNVRLNMFFPNVLMLFEAITYEYIKFITQKITCN
ncbi:MurR/RpiR family transcriptional regulator [Spirabiliibacterium falconis]|uniref:MurR/RpiR family transcriptional regulator n=1 Tax=Spirabiliibacterium falconis TaxID=572023 RepID=UPI001AAC9B98|nr:MurR/RpiR family transcriptional regulator [Spirabiliibacterium falconis]MBE2894285.1 MurR/RpiR family transcriptional regulator [Spirabiliibacterium falconis]